MSNPLPQNGQTPPDPDSLLSGGGGSRAGRTVAFKTLNEWKTFTIKGKETVQARDDEGDLEFWPDGNAKWVVVVTVATDERNPAIEDDDGVRYLWLKGSKDPSKKTLMSSTIVAYEAAGAKSLEVGGELSMAWVGEGVKSSPTRNPPKFYEAKFVPAADVVMRSGGSNGQAAATPAVAPPAAAPASTPAAPGPVANGNGNSTAADGLDWSRLGHLPAELRVKLIGIPGLTTDAVLGMYPAPEPAPASNGTAEFTGLRREDFPGVDERQWAAIKEAVEQKGASIEAMKAAFAV
jgi:hypothetical protein